MPSPTRSARAEGSRAAGTAGTVTGFLRRGQGRGPTWPGGACPLGVSRAGRGPGNTVYGEGVLRQTPEVTSASRNESRGWAPPHTHTQGDPPSCTHTGTPHTHTRTQGLFGRVARALGAENTVRPWTPRAPSASGRGTGQLSPVGAQAVLVSSARPREGPERDRREPPDPVPEEGGMGQSLPGPRAEGAKRVPLGTAGPATRRAHPGARLSAWIQSSPPRPPATVAARVGGTYGGWSSVRTWAPPGASRGWAPSSLRDRPAQPSLQQAEGRLGAGRWPGPQAGPTRTGGVGAPRQPGMRGPRSRRGTGSAGGTLAPWGAWGGTWPCPPGRRLLTSKRGHGAGRRRGEVRRERAGD